MLSTIAYERKPYACASSGSCSIAQAEQSLRLAVGVWGRFVERSRAETEEVPRVERLHGLARDALLLGDAYLGCEAERRSWR
jgi:hypothetical protein